MLLPSTFYPPLKKYSKYLIYGLVDPRTEEVRYIGKSCSGFIRIRQHFSATQLHDKTKKINWLKSLLELGLLPKPIILAECTSKEQLPELEVKFIAEYRAQNFNLLNMTSGGDGRANSRNSVYIPWNKGIKSSDNARLAMRNAKLGRKRKPRTAEEKSKISESNKVASKERCKPFVCLENGKIYNSQREAIQELSVTSGNLSGVLNGHKLSTKGYSFKYV